MNINQTQTLAYQHDLCLLAYNSDASLLLGRLAVAIESLSDSLWPYDDHHDQYSGHFTLLLLTSISNSREIAYSPLPAQYIVRFQTI